jgi:hypothetical protein
MGMHFWPKGDGLLVGARSRLTAKLRLRIREHLPAILEIGRREASTT